MPAFPIPVWRSVLEHVGPREALRLGIVKYMNYFAMIRPTLAGVSQVGANFSSVPMRTNCPIAKQLKWPWCQILGLLGLIVVGEVAK